MTLTINGKTIVGGAWIPRRPWLSVVMPTYEGAAYLRAALDSVVAQDEPDLELLVVDEGSQDGTVGVVESYMGRLPISLIRRRHTGNWITSTNLAMAAATGEYLCWLHQDDVWHPGRLRTLRALTSRFPDAALLVHPCRYIDARGRAVGVRRCPLPRRAEGLQPADVLPRLVVQSSIAASGTLFKTEAYRQAGELDEQLWYLADWDYWLRLASLGRTIYHPMPLASCRLHAESLSMARAACGADLRRQHKSVLKRHLSSIQRLGIDKAGLTEAALWSAQVNLALLAAAAGQPVAWRQVCRALSLSPAGWFRYWRDARLFERLAARLRAGALSWRRARPDPLGDAVRLNVSLLTRRASEGPDKSPLDEPPGGHVRQAERHAPLEAAHHARSDDYG